MQIKLPRDVEYIIEKIESHGYLADVVGGPVRDFLLGKRPLDYDITTSATPDKVKEIFSDFRTVDTGIKHGTVTVVLGGVGYEITTYRVDGEYKDSRHPESVSFTDSLAEDLARRDFTMNAISYNPVRGFTDPFFGSEDIRRGVIRAVGEPRLRFTEDALRILRGARFSAVLGFSVEPQTRRAMSETAQLLSRVSEERIYTEWKKLLSGEFAYRALSEFSDIIGLILPEIGMPRLPDEARFMSSDFTTRQLALFYLSLGKGAAEAFEAAMRRLKTDKRTRTVGRMLLQSVGKYDTATERGRHLLLVAIGDAEIAEGLIRLECLLRLREPSDVESLREELARGIPYRISDLAISGDELTALGYRGRAVGEVLESTLLAVARGELSNEREVLLSSVTKLK